MRVAVMMFVAMRMRVTDGESFGRRNAAIEELAANVLELNGGVADLILLAKQAVEPNENARAL